MKRILTGIGMTFVLPVLLFVMFSIASNNALGVHTISIIVSQSMIPLCTALGLAFAMTAGITPMSASTSVVLAGVCGGLLSQVWGVPGLIIGCLAGGVAVMLATVYLFRFLRIPSMITSFGLVQIIEIVSYTFLNHSSNIVRLPEGMDRIGSYPNNVYIMAVMCVLFYFLFYKSKLGNQIQLIQGNEELAGSLGLNAGKIKTGAMVLTGLFAGVAGFLMICYSANVSVTIGGGTMTMVFKPLMSVFLAFTMLKFLNVMPLCILSGTFIIQIIFNGFVAIGFETCWQNIFLGVFMIAVMFLNTNMPAFREKIYRSGVRKAGIDPKAA